MQNNTAAVLFIIVVCFFGILTISVSAQNTNDSSPIVLEWNLNNDDVIQIDKYFVQTNYWYVKDPSVLSEYARGAMIQVEDGIYRISAIQKNHVILHTATLNDTTYSMSGEFYSYEQLPEISSSFKLLQIFPAQFQLHRTGSYTVPANRIMPNIRSIPTFPPKPVSIGTKWQANGTEVWEFDPPITIPVIVNYTVSGFEEKAGVQCARINADYSIFYENPNGINNGAPVLWEGVSELTIWWDYQNGMPVYRENKYEVSVYFTDSIAVNYAGTITSFYQRKSTADRQTEHSIEREIAETLPADKHYSVSQDDRGVVIEFGDILFDFDSATLSKKAQRKLRKIIPALKKHKSLSIQTHGHTDNIGDARYNIDLSERRAAAVINFLINEGVVDSRNASYVGFGETMPIADNKTDAGRLKNRRVEIIIQAK